MDGIYHDQPYEIYKGVTATNQQPRVFPYDEK